MSKLKLNQIQLRNNSKSKKLNDINDIECDDASCDTPLLFQITDIKSYDEEVDEEEIIGSEEEEEDEDSDEDDNKNKNKNNYSKNTDKFFLTVFGITNNNKAISIKVKDFEPYFYIYAPEINTKSKLSTFIDCVKSNFPKKFELKPITKYSFVKRKQFIGFNPEIDEETGKFKGNKSHRFIYIKFRSKQIMQKCANILTPRDDDRRILKNKRAVDKLNGKGFDFTNRPMLYESNIDPMLRFLHIQELKPCGWATIQKNKYKINTNYSTNSYVQIDAECDWKSITFVDKPEISKLVVASYDIEADSSHGDFPIAVKDFKKLAANIYDAVCKFVKMRKAENKKQSIFDNKELIVETIEKIKEYILMGYSKNENAHDIEFVYSKNRVKPAERELTKLAKLIVNLFFMDNKSYQVNFNDAEVPKGTVFKIKYDDENDNGYPVKDIQVQYWLKSKKGKEYKLRLDDIIINSGFGYKIIHNKFSPSNNFAGELQQKLVIKDKFDSKKQLVSETFSDQDEITKILNKFIKEKRMKKTHKIALTNFETCFAEFKNKRDLLIEEVNKTMTRYLPEIEGDKVIQIGTVVQNYGEQECSIKHIVTLKGCSHIEGVIVESCEHERDVIIKWCKFISKLDPDIILGYNIFGFDYKFIWERAVALDCADVVSKLLTRIKTEKHLAILETQKLSSAGLGDNVLYYINMPGRIQVDLYKIIQRDHKLDAYKLDFVSAHFINGDILDCTHKKKNDNNDSDDNNENKQGRFVKTNNIIGLVANNYITFGIKTLNGISKFEDGKKFKILNIDIENKELEIDCAIKLDMKKYKYQWGLAKDDVSPKDIFRLQKGSDSDRAIVAKYCVMDCELVINLANKLDIITNNIGMANVCSVPLSFIFLRGQGIKIFSLVAKYCRLENTLVPVLDGMDDMGDKDGYEGACVLKPRPGIYLNEPVAVLDYSSLYPSSMISENLSHDTLVFDPLYLGKSGAKRLEKMGLQFEDITYTNYKYVPKGKQWIKIVNEDKPTITCRYVQPYKEEHEEKIDDAKRGIIPRILQTILEARKITRKKQKTEGDKFKWNVLEGQQLAYKVSANSLYGAIGARTSQVYLKDIAASTTATGRKLLELAKDTIEKDYVNSTTIYGDSVTGDEPLLLRCSDGTITIKTIECLSEETEWEQYENFKPFDTKVSNRREKQKCETVQGKYEVWANDKWNPITKVIRHKTNKKIYRVNTYSGVVDVTEDHSLLDDKLKKIKPEECIVGETKLSHTYPTFNNGDKNPLTFDEICDDALFIKYDENNADIHNDILNSKIYKLRSDYFSNYSLKYGTINDDNIEFKLENKLHMAKIYYLSKSINLYASIDLLKNNQQCIHVYHSTEARDFYEGWLEPTTINSMTKLRNSEDEYVYDLETQDGIFHCGVGEIQVKNTDSVFMSFKKYILKKHGSHIKGKELLELTIKYAIEAGKRVNLLLKHPHDLEYEKTFWPFILLSKKRYVGNKYEIDINIFKQTSMGIVLKRRDNAPIVKYIYGGIIDRIINQLDIQLSISFLKKSLQELLDGKFGLDNLIITKTLKGYYKVPDQIAHKVLATRMGSRDPGNKPQSNDRIPFVYIEADKNEKLQGNKIEHPKFIIENNIDVDYGFYITNQILKPVSQIYALILETLDGYNRPKKYFEKLRRKVEKKQPDKVKVNKKIQDEKMKEVKKILFKDALRQCENKKDAITNLNDWFTVTKVEKTKYDMDDKGENNSGSDSDSDDDTHNQTKNKLKYYDEESDEEKKQQLDTDDDFSDYEDTHLEF
jgi:DNA polymerase elongation subunit (family B)